MILELREEFNDFKSKNQHKREVSSDLTNNIKNMPNYDDDIKELKLMINDL